MFVKKSKYEALQARVKELEDANGKLEIERNTARELADKFKIEANFQDFTAKDVSRLCKVLVLGEPLERFIIKHCDKYTISSYSDHIVAPSKFIDFIREKGVKEGFWVDAKLVAKYLNLKGYVEAE